MEVKSWNHSATLSKRPPDVLYIILDGDLPNLFSPSFLSSFLSFLTWLYILSTHDTVGLIFFTVRGKERVSYPSLFFSEDQKLVEVFRQKRGRNFLTHLHFAPQSHKIFFFSFGKEYGSLSYSLDTRSKHLLRVGIPAGSRPDPFHNPFFLPYSKHFELFSYQTLPLDECELASPVCAVIGWR